MSGDVYHQLARVLDTLPNGFPATESGIEIKPSQEIKDVTIMIGLESKRARNK